MQATITIAVALSLALLGGCAGERAARPDAGAAARTEPVIKEAFVTVTADADNLDSPAVWHADNGDVRVYITAKSTDAVRVFDGISGASLGSIGRRGTGAGEFLRPNGISVVGDILFVVERDGHRVQAFALPDARAIGSFGADTLKKPYGLWVREDGPRRYRIYVTDDWAPPATADGAGARKVHVFDVAGTDPLVATHVSEFGDAGGAGRLRIVESIFGDTSRGELLIADELESDGSRLKLFDMQGRYRGRDIGAGIYRHQAEGFALYACADGSGYWIGSDQSPTDQRYLVFDRATFEYVGAVRPTVANTTDGVWLDQRASTRFPAGALYVSHSDNAVAAFDWRDIASALTLRPACAP